MQQSIVEQFCDLMASHGCPPKSFSDIVPDDRRGRIACQMDKGAEKTITYQLKIDGNFGVGWFHSFKFGNAGQTHTFTSRMGKDFTSAEKEAWVKASAIAKLKAEENRKKKEGRQDRMANRVETIISRLKPAEGHPYLSKKKIQAHGLKIRNKGRELVLPIYQPNHKPYSIQRICPDGTKLFLCGGRIKGGYYPMTSAKEEKSIIIIAEGFATAASIREASGLPVICALNAGNLEPVAKSVRHKYPKSKIVIAADNDRYTKDSKGKPYNPGIEKASKAAKAISGVVIYPDFPDNNKGSDWNDLICAEGDAQWHKKMQPLLAARGGVSSSVDVVSPPRTAWILAGEHTSK